MLFAIRYQPQNGRSDEESRRLRALLIKWQPPEGVAVRHHFHYVSGGGVLIVESADPSTLYETMEPFKSRVLFDVEPVINFIEAVAISTDIEEWVAAASTEGG